MSDRWRVVAHVGPYARLVLDSGLEEDEDRPIASDRADRHVHAVTVPHLVDVLWPDHLKRKLDPVGQRRTTAHGSFDGDAASASAEPALLEYRGPHEFLVNSPSVDPEVASGRAESAAAESTHHIWPQLGDDVQRVEQQARAVRDTVGIDEQELVLGILLGSDPDGVQHDWRRRKHYRHGDQGIA